MLSPKLPGPLLRHYGAQALSPVAERFYGRRWTPATSSNLSLRVDDDRALVTASGGHKRFLTGDALVLMGLDGTMLDGAEGAQPSAEAALHLALYARDR
ncbi:MAG: class II aldolase/adducin family protein, partial [Pseudomonadales bacterium]